MAKVIPDKTEPVWNIFDEKSLLIGLDRKIYESNIDLRNRIIKYVRGNSTKQGIADWLLNIFDVNELYPEFISNNIIKNYVFTINHQPMTKYEYEKLMKPDINYYYPVVIDDETRYNIEYVILSDGSTKKYVDLLEADEYDHSKDVSSLGEWTLYKQLTGAYSRILIANYLANSIQLEYVAMINDELYEVIESPVRP